MDHEILTFIKLLLGTISPFIILLIIDHYNMKNKTIITQEEIEEALSLIDWSKYP